MSYYTYFERLGGRLFVKYIDDKGRRRSKVFSQCPLELFIKGDREDSVSLMGERLSRVEFDSVKDCLDFVKEYEGATEIFGQTSPEHQFVAKAFPGELEFDIKKFRILNFDIEVRHDNGFPHPSQARDEILSISMKLFGEDQDRVTLGLKGQSSPADADRVYVACTDEAALLRTFLNYWVEMDPDIITGWNIDGFDIPYLVNRITKVLGEGEATRLSPFHAQTSRVFRNTKVGHNDMSYRILGITSYDYMNLYKKFSTKKLESYRLDFVAQTEVDHQKTDLSRWGNDLMRLYNEDFETFVEYNENDVDLVEKLDSKLRFIHLAVTISLMTHSKYHEALGSVAPWDNMLYNMLLERGIQIPPADMSRAHRSISGAYVKEPITAKYKWVVSMDLTSLYPGIVRMYNMSPETLVQSADKNPAKFLEGLLEQDWDMCQKNREIGLVTAANGSAYSQDQEGVMPHAMTMIFKKRKRIKKKMLGIKSEIEKMLDQGSTEDAVHDKRDHAEQLDALQHALKILLNSGYGVMANKMFRYFNVDIAEGITLTGQLTIRYISDRTNEFLNEKFKTKGVDYVITNDTDSMYLCLDRFVTHVLKIPETRQKEIKSKIVDCVDHFVNTNLVPFLKEQYQVMADNLGSINNTMDMKREAIADAGIFRGKKNYILQVWDNEGVRYSTPEMKAVGVEVARTSTPKMVRDKLKESYVCMLNESNEELLKLIDKFRQRFYNSDLVSVASPRGVSDIEKWEGNSTPYKKGTPIHVKGAIMFNNLVDQKGVGNKYQKIRSGSKIKFIYLKEPNPVHCTAIAFIDELPSEFGLDKYLDVEKQFEKVYLAPLKSFTDLIGWQVEKIATLDDLWE